jgi:hypothetical protein
MIPELQGRIPKLSRICSISSPLPKIMDPLLIAPRYRSRVALIYGGYFILRIRCLYQQISLMLFGSKRQQLFISQSIIKQHSFNNAFAFDGQQIGSQDRAY